MEDQKNCFFCESLAQTVCSSCKVVAYCSDEHYKVHRPEKICFPFVVRTAPNVGRYLVATREIKASELILYDQALVIGPKVASYCLCLQCIKPLPRDHEYLCSVCKWPVCDKKCEGGITHQRECSILASHPVAGIKGPEQYRCITPLRLLLSRDLHPDRFSLTEKLMDHNEDRKKYSEMWTDQQASVNEYLKRCALNFSDEDYDRAVGLLWTNSFACKKSEGQVLFPVFSIISHSCVPNANAVLLNSQQLALEAKMDIQRGEEVTISYISILQGRVKRRKKLKEKWFFDCRCKRCCDPSELGSHVSTLKCSNGECLGLVMAKSGETEDQVCSKCGFLMTAEDIDKSEDEAAMEIQKELDASPDDMQDLLKRMALKFHERHYLVILVKKHLIGMFSDDLFSLTKEKLKERLKLCEEVLLVLNIINPGRNIERGAALRHKAETKKMLLKKMKMNDEISDAEFTDQVKKCVAILSESQDCMAMLVRKDYDDN